MKHTLRAIFISFLFVFRSLLALFNVQKFSAGSISSHRCAVNSYHRIKCFGWNSYGELGLGDTSNRGDSINTINNNLHQVYLGYDAMEVSVGFDFTCVLSYNNLVRCFGANTYGQLGNGNTNSIGDDELINNLIPINFGTDFTPIKIRSGRYHSCALSDTNQITCWGRNNYGQLGIGNTNNIGDDNKDNFDSVDLGAFAPVNIELGGFHSCAISSAGNVKCWGCHGNGQLGLGYTVTGFLEGYLNHRGDQNGEMGSNLSKVDLGTNFAVKQLALGTSHSCAISTQNSVKCWGDGSNGRLGYGDTSERGVYYTVLSYDMGDNLPVISFGSNFIPDQIAAGHQHTCALSSNNFIRCWGEFDYGQLGSQPAATGYNRKPETMNVVALGDNFTPISIILGYDYSCAISNQNTGKCWGRNDVGQLGIGNTQSTTDITYMGNSLPIIQLGDDLIPTQTPTTQTDVPSNAPTQATLQPTRTTKSPTDSTNTPTRSTSQPTYSPTPSPTPAPSRSPTKKPTNLPSKSPTDATLAPTFIPTKPPTFHPTKYPSTRPTNHPSFAPTTRSPTEKSKLNQSLRDLLIIVAVILSLICLLIIGFIFWFIFCTIERRKESKNKEIIEIEMKHIQSIPTSPQMINVINYNSKAIKKNKNLEILRNVDELILPPSINSVNSEGIIKNRAIHSYIKYKSEGKNQQAIIKSNIHTTKDKKENELDFEYEKPINKIIMKNPTSGNKLDFVNEYDINDNDNENNINMDYVKGKKKSKAVERSTLYDNNNKKTTRIGDV